MPLRVVLVEDDTAIVEFVRLGLGYEGYLVEAVGSAEQASESLRRDKPDLLVLDLLLPGRSGLELLRAVRRGGDDVPVIILSAQHEVPDRVAGFEAGAYDYLTRPFRFEELLARMELLLCNVNRVLTREVLMTRLRGIDWIGDSNVLEVHVSRLRRRFGDEGPRLIQTVRGVGYALRPPL